MFRKISLLILLVSAGFAPKLSAMDNNSSSIWSWKTMRDVLCVGAVGLGFCVGWKLFAPYYVQQRLDQQLLVAVRKSGYKEVKRLVAQGANKQVKDEVGCTPQERFGGELCCAVKNNDFEGVKTWLELGADINAPEAICGPTPLWSAVEKGNVEIVTYLVEHGACIEVKQWKNEKPLLHRALEKSVEASSYIAKLPYLKILDYLIEHTSDVDITDKNKRTLLHWASKAGAGACVELLLKCKANVNAQDERDITPLYMAVEYGTPEVVSCLIKQGADRNKDGALIQSRLDYRLINAAGRNLGDVKAWIELGAQVNAMDFFGRTALSYAAEAQCFDIIKYLVEQKANLDLKSEGEQKTPRDWLSHYMRKATKKNDFNGVKTCLELGADVNAKSKNRKTALYWAAKNGDATIIAYLLAQKASRDIKAHDRKTARYWLGEQLRLAAACGDLKRVKTFLGFGAGINAKDDAYYNTPLQRAVEKGKFEVVKYLVEHGAKINEKNDNSATPLHYAARESWFEIVRYLIDHNADVDVADISDRTPLHRAAESGSLPIIKYLVEHKADVNTKGLYGWTPLHWAACKERLDIVKYLVVHGADPNVKNNDQKTPADLTANPEIKEYLEASSIFKTGSPLEIAKYVEKELSVTDPETAKKKFKFLCEVVLPDASKPGVLYWAITDKFNEFNREQFGFTFKTQKEFYLHMLELYKLAPSKVLLDFCRELFRICKGPLTFGKTSDGGKLPFEAQLENRFDGLFVPKEKTADTQDLLEKYGKVKVLYNKDYRFPAMLAATLNKKKFADLKLTCK